MKRYWLTGHNWDDNSGLGFLRDAETHSELMRHAASLCKSRIIPATPERAGTLNDMPIFAHTELRMDTVTNPDGTTSTFPVVTAAPPWKPPAVIPAKPERTEWDWQYCWFDVIDTTDGLIMSGEADWESSVISWDEWEPIVH